MAETFSIREAAERTGVSVHTLRYYESVGILQEVARRQGGARSYCEEDLGWIEALSLLRSCGMPIRRLQVLAHLRYQGDAAIPQRVELLREYCRELGEQIRLRERAIEVLKGKIGWLEADHARFMERNS